MRFLAMTLCAVLVSAPLGAQGKGQGKGKGKQGGGTAVSVQVVFTSGDQRLIREWVQARPAAQLPPGLAKRGGLPPGLAKQLRKNGTLPPGLEKRITAIPLELGGRLGPLPPGCGCDRVFFDGKALIVARATGAILDLIDLF